MQLLQDVLDAPDGPEVGALFDFDGTVIAGFSATAMLQEKILRRDLSPEQMIELFNVMAQWSTGGIGFSGLMSGAAKLMKGISEESFYDFGEELYEKHIARKIYPETRALIEAHLSKGHTVAIVSSASIYQIEPSARDLNIEHVLCSRYEVKDGKFTGEVQRPLCYGEGKVLAARKLAKITPMQLEKSFFYSDSDEDIELLETVGNPRVLNPNFRLEMIAKERDWPMHRFTSRGRAGPVDYTRTLYATGSMVGAFLAGLPIWGMTGSRQEGINFSVGLFGDVAAALSGVTLEINGEENLWKARPCIFIFNHQSKADLMILAKLIRKNFAGIAKKEFKDIPIVGQVLDYMGTVFIDRSNTASAIETLEPLIDAIKNDGKSIVIAPEGTRTLTPKLGAFKKGPFYMAYKAGVPLVPIVIHNSGDIAPKGEFIIRPARVRIDVLEPIEVKDWSMRRMNEHIREVRNQFLRVLGQEEEEAALAKLKAAAGEENAAEPALADKEPSLKNGAAQKSDKSDAAATAKGDKPKASRPPKEAAAKSASRAKGKKSAATQSVKT